MTSNVTTISNAQLTATMAATSATNAANSATAASASAASTANSAQNISASIAAGYASAGYPYVVGTLGTASIGGIMGGKYWPYDIAPPHPDGWDSYSTGDLQEAELHEVQSWLWLMAQGKWSVVTHYTPSLRLLVYFERPSDAVSFRLAWSGNL